ncbi:hypothetical protein AB204_20045 [Xenorhabdus khoisanae]|uniref:Uncharacterized protein n=1 Tax=Xenorhabdus khoisanae TaxID=880157 RepID=A0A0J5FMN4_9GAMM|nr:hypothetical protein [Xenorhabdus khoisanae]KMJ43374.1 hypothetical protein AB204_20045 [Xenorhabdus khoisanae]
MSQGTATSTFTVGIKYDTETLSQLESQLERIAELMDRIDGRREVGTKQAEYKDAATIINEVEQAYHAQGVFSGKLRSLVSKVGINLSDDHLRYIIREELKTLITREIRPGGLLARR